MAIIVKDEKKEYPKASEGQHLAVCVDVVGPWEAVDDFDKDKPYPIQKIAYVFQLDESRQDGKPFEVAREFSLTFGQKANLRKFLSGWRGKAITDDEAKAGVDIDYTGKPAYLTIEHKAKRAGGTRVEVASVMPPPKQLPPITPQPYTRAEYWKKRADEDQAKSRALAEKMSMVRAAEARNAADFSEPPAGLDTGNDDLPFSPGILWP